MKIKTAHEIIKALLIKEKLSVSKLAAMMSTDNKKVYQQSLSYKLLNDTLKYKEMVQICDILGYEIEFKKLHKGK